MTVTTHEVVWTGEVDRCQLCKSPLNGVMIDGRIILDDRSTWANVCEQCHSLFGVGLGTGRGQKYHWDGDGQFWFKVAG